MPLEGGGGGVGLSRMCLKPCFTTCKKKHRALLTQKELAYQISADSEQLGKLQRNRYICLPSTEPFNWFWCRQNWPEQCMSLQVVRLGRTIHLSGLRWTNINFTDSVARLKLFWKMILTYILSWPFFLSCKARKAVNSIIHNTALHANKCTRSCRH